MQQATLTVEALRCWQCQRLMHPTEPFFRRQMITAKETGPRRGEVHRWEPVNVCKRCEQAWVEDAQLEVEHARRSTRIAFLIVGGWVAGAWLLQALPQPLLWPVGACVAVVGVGWSLWKWHAKKQLRLQEIATS